MNKQRKKVIAANEVSSLNTYCLGGHNQKVLLDGKSKDKPLLLVLHGGPGMPMPFSAGCRGMFPEFTDCFIMVYWDQLGCGINDYTIDNSFTINHFVNMTSDLIMELKKEFPNNRLNILATSWGSVLAAKVAEKLPGSIDNVLVCGQITKDMFFNDEVYNALHNETLSRKDQLCLTKIQEKQQHSIKELKELTIMIRKYTEGYQAKTGGKMPIGMFIRGLLSSPDYSFKNFIAIVKNGLMKNESIWNELMRIDLSKEIEAVKVPYRILQGSTDIVTSTKTLSSLISKLNNPNISFHIIENCGHIPNEAAMKEILSECIRLAK